MVIEEIRIKTMSRALVIFLRFPFGTVFIHFTQVFLYILTRDIIIQDCNAMGCNGSSTLWLRGRVCRFTANMTVDLTLAPRLYTALSK